MQPARATNTDPADTIRILVASDNHVGYEERDPVRGEDSWRTFDEIMELARSEDVDMVLLGGDLFHDNKPSRKSMYQVMRSLRRNVLGDRPCELEFLSDAALVFEGAFAHVNYEDPDINVSIPVFSIHGNHDDPSGEGHLCSLDLLQCAGLVNYYGRVTEGDNIEARPVLLRKGDTRLALYGLSNVRDERMYRTFRDGNVKWFRPGAGSGDWFNLLAVHQNHHAHTATSYLPENVLPDWLDLVVWGHEHECLIDPQRNPETGFHVIQPGSSVATSLVPGEAVRKHVAVVSVTGRDFRVRKIPLRTVRPMVTREIVLARDERFRGLERKKDNRHELTRLLSVVVEEMIDEAAAEWVAVQEEEGGGGPVGVADAPAPLIRLKVEYTAAEGGSYDIENPQRFSNRFGSRAANVHDIIYYYRKKSAPKKATAADIPEASEQISDTVKVEDLVQEYLAVQSLKILPQAPFGDAVTQFVTKDDKLAMDTFVSESLDSQIKQILALDSDEAGTDDLDAAMERYKAQLEAQFRAGALRTGRRRMIRPRPDDWDSDLDGHWDVQPGVWTYEPAAPGGGGGGGGGDDDDGDDDVPDATAVTTTTKRAPARRAAAPASGGGKPAATATRGRKPAAAARSGARPRKNPDPAESESEEDLVMDSGDGDDNAGGLPLAASSPTRVQPRRGPGRGAGRQTTLDFSQASSAGRGRARGGARRGRTAPPLELSDDEISDDSFEPVTKTARAGAGGRGKA